MNLMKQMTTKNEEDIENKKMITMLKNQISTLKQTEKNVTRKKKKFFLYFLL